MIEARRLHSLGMGLTDAQLIASIFLNPPTPFCGQETSRSAGWPEFLAFTPR